VGIPVIICTKRLIKRQKKLPEYIVIKDAQARLRGKEIRRARKEMPTLAIIMGKIPNFPEYGFHPSKINLKRPSFIKGRPNINIKKKMKIVTETVKKAAKNRNFSATLSELHFT
jgi:hypothetical protein